MNRHLAGSKKLAIEEIRRIDNKEPDVTDFE